MYIYRYLIYVCCVLLLLIKYNGCLNLLLKNQSSKASSASCSWLGSTNDAAIEGIRSCAQCQVKIGKDFSKNA